MSSNTNRLLIGAFILLAIFGGYLMFGALFPNQDDYQKGSEASISSDQIPKEDDNKVVIDNTQKITPEIKPDKPTVPTIDKTNNKPVNKEHTVTIKTNLGEIKFVTYDVDAPKTVQNFINLANKGFYNGVIFHRVIPGFMIQGGDPTGTGMGGPGYQFEDELNPATDSYKEGYLKGVVAMANSGPNTNGSQFFIMVADYPLPNNYTIFGKVVIGQDVADAISKVERNRSDKPLSPVTIEKVSVETN